MVNPTQTPATRNRLVPEQPGLIHWWELYQRLATAIAASTRKDQQRDFEKFHRWITAQYGDDLPKHWTPRSARDFQGELVSRLHKNGSRSYSDSTIDRISATLKPFAAWIDKQQPFLLGNPMTKIRGLRKGNRLELERALTPSDYRRLLDAADRQAYEGGAGSSKSRKSFRGFRNRALIYVLVETGMRRASAVSLQLDGIDWDCGSLRVIGKGAKQELYSISAMGLEALRDYLNLERGQDAAFWSIEAVFLAAHSVPRGNGRLTPRSVNHIWNRICREAGVSGRTPHSARHYMGLRLIQKSGNPALVQKQLNHVNPGTSMGYCAPTREDIKRILDEYETE